MDEIRYGIIGSGMMGIEHMLNIQLCDAARVVAVADPHETSRGWAKLTANEAKAPLALYSDTREMLERETL